MGNKNDANEDFTKENFEEEMKAIDENDPKAHFKKLALYRRLNTRKRTLEKQIEKITYLDKDGAHMKRFRKADELYYLMK